MSCREISSFTDVNRAKMDSCVCWFGVSSLVFFSCHLPPHKVNTNPYALGSFRFFCDTRGKCFTVCNKSPMADGNSCVKMASFASSPVSHSEFTKGLSLSRRIRSWAEQETGSAVSCYVEKNVLYASLTVRWCAGETRLVIISKNELI